MKHKLPSGLSLRPATPEDAAAVAELLYAFDSAFLEEPDRPSERDVLDWWRNAVATAVVAAEGGRLAALGTLRRRGERYEADNFVHPGFAGQGIGSSLLDWSEERARAAGVKALHVAVLGADSAARRLLEARGYGYVRSFYRMVIDLDKPPAAPDWPEGFAVATMRPGEERLFYETLEEAFAGHWGHVPRTFAEWSKGVRFEPELSFLVRVGGEVAAAELCRRERFGMGWIGTLGVRPAWRRRGIGRALLLHAFGELHRLGRRRIGLGVDAENTTGAVGLYEGAGMRVSWQADIYEKSPAPVGS